MKGETHHGAWLEVHEDCTWDVLATRCLVVVHIDALELEAAWEHGAVEEDASDEHQITENKARLNNAVVSVFISSLKTHHTKAQDRQAAHLLRVSVVRARWVDTVLIGDDLPSRNEDGGWKREAAG